MYIYIYYIICNVNIPNIKIKNKKYKTLKSEWKFPSYFYIHFKGGL